MTDTATLEEPQSPPGQTLVAFVPDKKLERFVHQLVRCHMDINALEQQRDEYMREQERLAQEDPDSEELSKEATSELSRQQREISRLPDLSTAHKSFTAFNTKLDKLLDKVESDKEYMPDDGHLQSVRFGGQQLSLLIRRAQMVIELMNITALTAAEERLYGIMVKHGMDPKPLYGWAILLLTLEYLRDQCDRDIEAINEEIEAAKEYELEDKKSKKAGIKGLLGRKKKKDAEEEQEEEVSPLADYDYDGAQEKITQREAYKRACVNELETLTKPAVESFWSCYFDLAGLYVKEGISEEERVPIRAVLRYGLIGESHYYLPPDLMDKAWKSCQEDVKTSWDLGAMGHNVIHADEYIDLVTKGELTPAFDEDLELNQRNTDPWKKDKAWRSLISGKVMLAQLEAIDKELESAMQEAMDDAEHATELMNDFKESGESKAKIRKQKEMAMESKSKATRIKQNLDKIRKDFTPKAQGRIKDGESKLGEPYPPEFLAMREAKEIRRVSSLVNRLVQPYLPLELRTGWDPEKDAINTRKTILQQVQGIEWRDPLMFKDEIIKHNKKDRRVYQRTTPAVIITPGLGYMGFSWGPRNSSETGRMVFPGYMPRGDILESIIFTTFSDFRWDTAKETAGSDLMNSDTICAAYMTVRWDYRKKSKEGREKAGIVKEQTDRENFRRHYALYMSSADDGGKQLFYKCYECYLAFLKYFELPAGVQKLEKN